jgi:hypothetical protein
MRHSKNIKLIAFLSFSLSVVGCTTTMRVESNKAPDYTANIHRLAIIENLGPVNFQQSFDKNLTEMMRTCGAQATFINPLQIFQDPTGSVLTKGASGNSFDAVLTIELTSFDQLTRYGVPVGDPGQYHYAFTLKNTDGKKVWKALITFVAGNVILSDKGQVFASDVVKQMNTDGLFTGCTPIQP